jgi:predicted DsbA family dithiol-disulfide isomerase
MATAKMKVEVWSDIMCPFCYIGKRKYESALQQFEGSEDIEIQWKSFQLDPTIPEQNDRKQNVYEYLAERKGMSYEHSVKMHENVVEIARNAGLTYNFDKAIIVNSFKAHKMIQLAKTKGLGDAAEERLFYAYFTEGKDFGDTETLIQLGTEIGLDEADIRAAINSEEYAAKVKADIEEARNLGVTGVPFFVFNRSYAVSGAQPPEAFLQTLNKSFAEWRAQHPAGDIETSTGAVCTPDGCD